MAGLHRLSKLTFMASPTHSDQLLSLMLRRAKMEVVNLQRLGQGQVDEARQAPESGMSSCMP